MRKVFNFDYGWKFRKDAEVKSVSLSDYFGIYANRQKTGTMTGPAGSFFDDTDWTKVTLPHDWCIYEDFAKMNNPPGTTQCGNKPSEPVWYRKNFVIDKKYDGKKIFLKFDGIAIDSEIYLNNILLTTSNTSYVPIVCDITDFVEPGRPCALAVRCMNKIKEGWWYEGGGIYRHAHLIITENTHFENDGVFAAPIKTDKGWKVRVRTYIEGDLEGLTVESKISGTDKSATAKIDAAVSEHYIEFNDPKLWDDITPNLYELVCTLYKDGKAIDELKVNFGFREIKFDPDKGCTLNGRPIKLKGVCLHHDHGGVGVAVPDAVYDFRISKLKEMGCNAIRTSHNPQSPAFYDACNRYGVMVMNENRHFSSTPQELHNLEMFIKRDRNHPCVIMWSLLNEEPLQGSYIGRKIAQTMTDLINDLDGTRAITSGCNGPFQEDGVTRVVDVMGFNYMQYGYDQFHELFPHLPVFGSETGSHLTTRGIERTNRKKSHVARIGNILYENRFPWSADPGATWRYIAERDFVCGGFYWTGIDYYGESGPFYWPAVTSNFGAMDVSCFPKDNFYWHKAVWVDEPVLKIMPHWDFDKEGRKVNFSCYSNCEEIEVYINGESMGRFQNDKFDSLQKKFTFKAGVVEAIGFNGGKEVCHDRVETSGEAVAIKAEVVKKKIKAGTYDASVINLYAVDKNGVVNSRINDEIEFSINENGNLLGISNGDDACIYNTKGTVIPFFNGCAQAVVGAKDKGDVVLNVKAPFGETQVIVKAEKDTMESYNEAPNSLVIQAFYAADIYDVPPREDELMSDFYYWIPTPVGYGRNLLYSGKHGYGSIRGTFNYVNHDRVLHIDGLQGDVKIYINAKLIAEYNGDIKDLEIPMTNFDCEEQNRLQFVFKLTGKDCGVHGKVYFR